MLLIIVALFYFFKSRTLLKLNEDYRSVLWTEAASKPFEEEPALKDKLKPIEIEIPEMVIFGTSNYQRHFKPGVIYINVSDKIAFIYDNDNRLKYLKLSTLDAEKKHIVEMDVHLKSGAQQSFKIHTDDLENANVFDTFMANLEAIKDTGSVFVPLETSVGGYMFNAHDISMTRVKCI